MKEFLANFKVLKKAAGDSNLTMTAADTLTDEERERFDKIRVMAGGKSTITERFVPNCNDLETYLMVNAHLETKNRQSDQASDHT